MPRFGRSAIKPVIRRVGGLEVIITLSFLVLVVIRRVGGLEDNDAANHLDSDVIRRVGGLEV